MVTQKDILDQPNTTGDRPPSSRRVAVIGAGSAGLVSARELKREGHNVQVFEQGHGIGGIWSYQDEVEDDLLGRNGRRKKVHSSLYSSLRVNLPREIMSFSDFPFIPDAMGGRSKDSRRYPHHTEVLSFLEAFTEEFGVRPLIRFDTRVTHIEPLHTTEQQQKNNGLRSNGRETDDVYSPPQWAVTSEPVSTFNGQVLGRQTEVFDAVVVAVGNFSEPNLPSVEGIEAFPGLQMHCHNYRHSDIFKGKRVVVVGASFSGEEIARQIADVAEYVYHSARTWGSQLSEPLARPNLQRVPLLTSLGSDSSAEFSDGLVTENVDAVVYCTGYKYKYPFLEGTGLISTDDNRVKPLYRHIFVPSVAPTLAFIGLLWKALRNFQFELQARWVAQVLSGRVALPSREEMEADTEAFYKLLKRHDVPVRHTHCQTDTMPVNQWQYNETLRQSCSPMPPPVEAWRIAVHDAVSVKILQQPDTFRDKHTEEDQALFDDAALACAAIAVFRLDVSLSLVKFKDVHDDSLQGIQVMDRGRGLMATAPAPNPQDGSTVDDILTLIFNNDPTAAQLIKQADLSGQDWHGCHRPFHCIRLRRWPGSGKRCGFSSEPRSACISYRKGSGSGRSQCSVGAPTPALPPAPPGLEDAAMSGNTNAIANALAVSTGGRLESVASANAQAFTQAQNAISEAVSTAIAKVKSGGNATAAAEAAAMAIGTATADACGTAAASTQAIAHDVQTAVASTLAAAFAAVQGSQGAAGAVSQSGGPSAGK
ncbi:g4947 [Coccomyxa elongata]